MTEPAISELLATAGRPNADAQVAGRALVDTRQLLVALVRTLVAAEDVEHLNALCHDNLEVHRTLRLVSPPTRPGLLAEAPFRGNEPGLVHSARALAALGLTLVAPATEALATHLGTFRRWIECSGLKIDTAPVPEIPASVSSPHAPRMRSLANAGGLELLSFIWMAELDGWTRRGDDGPARRGPSVQVLLDLGADGQAAVLSLSRVPGLPAGLIPHPATMALTSADTAFNSAFTTAWNSAGRRPDGTVLWSLDGSAGPVLRVTGESLSLALAVLLDEQARLGRRLRGPLTVRRLRPRTAIVGRIDAADPQAASSVSGYQTKLRAVQANTRVVVPRADHEAALEANRTCGDDAELVPVATRQQAARAARKIHRTRLLTIAVATLLVAALTTGSAVAMQRKDARDRETRRLLALPLIDAAASKRRDDPRLALKLGLAANAIDPGEESRASLSETINATAYLGQMNVGDTPVDEMIVSPKGDRIAVVTVDGVTLWDMSRPAAASRMGQLPGDLIDVKSGVFADQGRTLILATSDDERPGELPDKLVAYNVSDPRRPVRGRTTALPGVTETSAFSMDGRRFVAGFSPPEATDDSFQLTIGENEPRGASIWDLSDMANGRMGKPRPLRVDGKIVADTLAFSPDGDRVAAADLDTKFAVWDVGDNGGPKLKVSQNLDDGAPNIYRLSLSRDGQALTVLNEASEVELWDIGTARPRLTARQIISSSPVFEAFFAPDQNLVLTHHQDGGIDVWDSSALNGPGSTVPLVRRLVGRTIRHWEPLGSSLVPLPGTPLIVSVGEEQIAIRDLGVKADPEGASPAAQACVLAGSGLSRQEWHQYVPDGTYRTTCSLR